MSHHEERKSDLYGEGLTDAPSPGEDDSEAVGDSTDQRIVETQEEES